MNLARKKCTLHNFLPHKIRSTRCVFLHCFTSSLISAPKKITTCFSWDPLWGPQNSSDKCCVEMLMARAFCAWGCGLRPLVYARSLPLNSRLSEQNRGPHEKYFSWGKSRAMPTFGQANVKIKLSRRGLALETNLKARMLTMGGVPAKLRCDFVGSLKRATFALFSLGLQGATRPLPRARGE